MKISHHPDDSTLMFYAAGTLAEPLSAVVCAHLAMCPHCVREVRRMERIGAALMNALEPAALSRPAPQMALRAMEADVEAPDHEPSIQGDIPVPLRHLLGARIDDVRWKRLGPGVWNVPVTTQRGSGDLRLLRVGPGRAMPEHGHGGTELTLILRGSYRDEFGTYNTGDIADLDTDAEHRPTADEKLGCICVIASERRARFKSLVARLFQPLTGF
jgi:putative transcriptional regulator